MDLSSYSEPVRRLLERPDPPMALVCTRKPSAWAAAELASARPAKRSLFRFRRPNGASCSTGA